ncbi:MAG: polyprenyl synthetase family protein [Burkholderiales bacterium]
MNPANDWLVNLNVLPPRLGFGSGHTPPIDAVRERINTRLDALVPSLRGEAGRLCEAMRYSLLAPGKRLRPMLMIVAASDLGTSFDAVLDPACAIEMIHTASLIMDDLPAMDNALMRRGRPTTHRHFGEGTAILASVALLNGAFGVIAQAPQLDRLKRLQLVNLLVDAVGVHGLVAGQENDLNLAADRRCSETLEALNYQKTGVLFAASLEGAGRIAGLSDNSLAPLRECGRHLGLAFQIADDLLDDSGCAAEIGKDVGKDISKLTIAQTLGGDGVRQRLADHVNGALAALTRAGASGGQLATLVQGCFAQVLP